MCGVDRDDLTSQDTPHMPMYVNEGGTLYGFCPGKANWDMEARTLFDLLVIIAESKALPKAGGLDDQDDDIIEQMSWFLPAYDSLKWSSRMRAFMGSGEKKPQTTDPNKPATQRRVTR